MDQWTRPRKCIRCGGQFSLAEHGTEEARNAARQLEAGMDPSTLTAVITRCPLCHAGKADVQAGREAKPADAPAAAPTAQAVPREPRMSEEDAIAAAIAAGEALRRSHRQYYLPFFKRAGIAVSGLSLAGIALVMGYFMLSKGEYNPIFWVIVLTLSTAGGIGLFIWARAQTAR